MIQPQPNPLEFEFEFVLKAYEYANFCCCSESSTNVMIDTILHAQKYAII